MPKEVKFEPKLGQVDYTNIRYCPVVNCVVTDGHKILLVQRSDSMRLYPSYWNGISGFLDDHSSIEEKVNEELSEELGLKTGRIISIKRGSPLLQEAPKYSKTWLVIPVLVTVSGESYDLDWEAQQAQWFTPEETAHLDKLPGFDAVLEQFFQIGEKKVH